MSGQVSYWIHMLSALSFIPLLFLPLSVRRWKSGENERIAAASKPWGFLLKLAHVFLILSLVTGMMLTRNFLSSWFWLVIIIFAVLGAILGITAKSLRLTAEAARNNQPFSELLPKLNRFSMLLALTVLAMFAVMSARW